MRFVLFALVLFAFLCGGVIQAQTKRPLARPPVRTELNAEIRFEPVLVGNTGVRFPRLTYYKDAKVMEAVNQKIDEITSEFGCGDDAPSTVDTYRIKSRVEYSTKQIFSIYASASWFCGLYPVNDSNISLTFDLKTGKLVEFNDLFQNYERDKVEILKSVFAVQIERSARLVATGKAKEGACETDADLYSLEHLGDSTFAYNFSAEGIKVQPSWPHVIEACSERVTVPYRKLRQFAAPDGILARVGE